MIPLTITTGSDQLTSIIRTVTDIYDHSVFSEVEIQHDTKLKHKFKIKKGNAYKNVT